MLSGCCCYFGSLAHPSRGHNNFSFKPTGVIFFINIQKQRVQKAAFLYKKRFVVELSVLKSIILAARNTLFLWN
jgi:hypothetical protein